MMYGFVPDWPAPATVGAYIAERSGGASTGPYASNNLGTHVGDDPAAVMANRESLLSRLNVKAQWLEQVHGTESVEAHGDGHTRIADACWTRQPRLACVVMTADCLPVLLCDDQGSHVAAVHCGWRGLAEGILQRTVSQFSAAPNSILAYLGPAIGQRNYQVGAEVRDALARSVGGSDDFALADDAFEKYRVDLYAVARAQLNRAGVQKVFGGEFCTFDERERFYSFRRDGVCGRMASLIWLR